MLARTRDQKLRRRWGGQVSPSVNPGIHSGRERRAFQYPPLIAFRRPKNLKDLLVRTTLTSAPPEPPGNYPCGVSRCKTCPLLKVMDEFSSNTTGHSYKVKFRASSKSANIMYLTYLLFLWSIRGFYFACSKKRWVSVLLTIATCSHSTFTTRVWGVIAVVGLAGLWYSGNLVYSVVVSARVSVLLRKYCCTRR